MPAPILGTKLNVPPPRPKAVLRPRLSARLNKGVQGTLTLISAPAGFGKSTLVSDWIAGCQQRAAKGRLAWLALDAGDNDPARFLTYLVAALRTVAPGIGAGAWAALQAPQPPPAEAIVTSLLNDLAGVADNLILVLDDYHVIDAEAVDKALGLLLAHLPPHVHVIMASREDPPLPLARLRAQGQLTELRAADLRFTLAEAAEFLNQVMGLDLSPDDVAALEARTEGWIAGLQLAALALQRMVAAPGQEDAGSFIRSFTGSHRFLMDYLLEEVLQQQLPSVQSFLLRTSILDRLCGPLCDAVCRCDRPGQETLEYLERVNLFIVPLDGERRWYRYHQLFGELLRQRLNVSLASGAKDNGPDAAELHVRASQWYEDNGLEIEAFQHAVAAHDVERAARLVEGKGMPGVPGMQRMPGIPRMPLQFRGALVPVLHWLAALPPAALDARPALWVMYASTLSMTGQLSEVEPKLQAAERALARGEPDDETRNLIGHIAAIRALLAATQNQVETIIAQSQRALEYLDPGNLAVRTATIWKLGIAYQLKGERSAAAQAYGEARSISQASGNLIINIAATTGLGNILETQNQLQPAAETYRGVLELAGDPQHPATGEAHLGLARILYEWNDLAAAEQHGELCLQLARDYGSVGDRGAICEAVLASVKLARGDAAGAGALLADVERLAREHDSVSRIPEIAAALVLDSLRRGNLAAAAQYARDLPFSQARVLLAQGNAPAALAVLEAQRQKAQAQGWENEQLAAMVLQAVAYQAAGRQDQAVQVLDEALAAAEPGGFVRTFVDEGGPLARLLAQAAARGMRPEYAAKLLAVLGAVTAHPQPLIEPLTQRELEILGLIAQGLSNQEIGERLYLALDTVKGHNRRIFAKLEVERRTEAVARGRELGLL